MIISVFSFLFFLYKNHVSVQRAHARILQHVQQLHVRWLQLRGRWRQQRVLLQHANVQKSRVQVQQHKNHKTCQYTQKSHVHRLHHHHLAPRRFQVRVILVRRRNSNQAKVLTQVCNMWFHTLHLIFKELETIDLFWFNNIILLVIKTRINIICCMAGKQNWIYLHSLIWPCCMNFKRVFFSFCFNLLKLPVKHNSSCNQILRMSCFLRANIWIVYNSGTQFTCFVIFIFNFIYNRWGGRNSVGLSSDRGDRRRHCDVRHTEEIPKRLPEQRRISKPGVWRQ